MPKGIYVRAPRVDPMIRLLGKIVKGDCWLWTGSTNNKGYGEIHLDGKTHLAHRVMYASSHGIKLVPGMELCVLHRCDNRRCIRPNHLFLGTPQENTDDMMKKGRWIPPRHIAAARAKRGRE